jgi:hypothetical protein
MIRFDAHAPSRGAAHGRPCVRLVRRGGVHRQRAAKASEAGLVEQRAQQIISRPYDVRRLPSALKARAMEHGIPIQIVRESPLLSGEPVSTDRRGLTPLSDRAWNLSTAFYYKPGGKP